MSRINITLDTVVNGKQVSFVAPCTSDNISGLTINGVDYNICDANNNNIGNTYGLWASNAIVSVIINTNTKRAYIQNAITPESIGAARIVHGSYFGSGSSNHTVTLQLPFRADFIAIAAKDLTNHDKRAQMFMIRRQKVAEALEEGSGDYLFNIVWNDDNSVTITMKGNYDCFDVEGKEYIYFAIG